MSKILLRDGKPVECIDKNCHEWAVTSHPLLGVPLCKKHSAKEFIDALTDGFNHSGWKKPKK